MKRSWMPVILAVAVILISAWAFQEKNVSCSCHTDKLNILWTSADAEVFNKVVYVYGLNSIRQNWWNSVELIVWGPSSKLLAENPDLQNKVKRMMDAGVVFTACLWCTDEYQISDQLRALGVDVKYMGKPLTDYLKANEKVLVF